VRRTALILSVLFALFPLAGTANAQSDLAAVMTVQSEGVEVQRVGTTSWIPVSVEAIVGVGDTIRTDETGRALITYFSDGVETTLEPSTEYRIEVFSGDEETFQLSVSVLAGQTRQRLERVLDAGSSYDVITPGVSLVARGTAFNVRVEPTGRSGMIVTEGLVSAEKETESAEVPAEFGVRAPEDGDLSDVVRASSFAELDAALDGCSVSLSTPDDVRINVRLGASTDYPVVGSVTDSEVTNVKGVAENGGWYRIDFRGGSGWLLASGLEITGTCAGLRQFEDNYGPEDATAYEFLGDPISMEDITNAVPAPSDEEDAADTEDTSGDES